MPQDLPGDPPDQSFLNSVRDFGIIQPIIMTEGPQGVKVAAGRRRIKAARLIGIGELGAVVFQEGWVSPESLTLIENRHRQQNALADLLAIEALIKAGNDEEKIAANLGVSKVTIKGRLRLRQLLPDLAKAMGDGKIFVSVAEKICTLPPEQQQEILEAYKKNGKVTLADIGAAQARAAAAKKAAAPVQATSPAVAATAPAASAPAPTAAAQRLEEEIIADLAGRGWKLKKGAKLIEATHKMYGFCAGADYPTLEQNVTRAESQWTVYNGLKAFQEEQERRKLLTWQELASELVEQLADLVPSEEAGITAAVEGLATLLGIAPPTVAALPKPSAPPVVV